ncbi:sialate O-acetylesterase [Brevundimonas sp.]|uniref:sialate O-acetylesterase n=1 Tax=Brevundimonas sp. TaxID=1871086 RepID=UPI003D0D1D29
MTKAHRGRGVGLALMVASAAWMPTWAASAQTAAKPLMASLFADHGVLQRDRPISVWGDAAPGETVSVTLGDAQAQGLADASGRWRAALPAQGAGGPYMLTARTAAGAVQSAQDVMVGDVFLCSGQSNMEQPIRYAQRAWDPVATEADRQIRLLTVAKDSAARPLDALRHPVSWSEATPQSVEEFSAVCFFFGQALRQKENVPVGLVSDSWGGSSLQTWIGADRLKAMGRYDPSLAALDAYADDPQAGVRRWIDIWQDWWVAKAGDRPWRDQGGDWTPVPDMTKPWEQWGAPALAQFDGMVWYRLEFDLTRAQAASGATLSLGMVDQINLTWINGKPVGVGEPGQQNYPVPDGVLKPGRNVLMVNVMDSWGDGGIFGPTEARVLKTADGASLPLDPFGWHYRPVSPEIKSAPRAPWEALFGLSTLSNAMIAPLHDYGLKGVLWYQGESNVGYEQDRYAEDLGVMMADWRARFGQPELPFLIAQLANFGRLQDEGGGSGWAEVRDAQRRAVEADPHAGLAVTIDLGDRHDIHPGQKREVGRRLARAAEAVIYGREGAKSGPAAVSASREADGRIRVRLRDAAGIRTVGSGAVTGLELCSPAETDCRYAVGHVSDSDLVIDATGSDRDVVRYCWDDAPICNLFDAADLPLGPFRLSAGR